MAERERAVHNLIVLKTGSTFDDLARVEGDFEDWFLRGLGIARETVEIVDARATPELPSPSRLCGAVVTGSPEMLTDGAAWIEPAAAWLRDLVAAQKPVLGVCFGHQLLAHALGGVVGWNPAGRAYGTIEMQCLESAEADALFGIMPGTFVAHSAHAQSVLTLPEGAVPLARSRGVEVQAARFGERAWGAQFHPEFSESIMRAYVRRHARTLAEDGADPDVLLNGVAASAAGKILERFGDWFRPSALTGRPDVRLLR
jgi:GMP synthase (glutamine-hydrolysing)